MNRKRILNMSLFAIFASFIVILGLVPNLGYITFIPGVASLTIVHIPVLIGIMLLPLGYAIGLGFIFGLTSLYASYVYAQTLFDYAFQNPIIAILPRVLFAVAAYFIFYGFKLLFNKLKNGPLVSFIVIVVISILFAYFTSLGLHQVTGWNLLVINLVAITLVSGLLVLYYFFLKKERYKNLAYVPAVFITATLIHSILVLSMIALMKPAAYEGANILGVILAVMSTNALFEALAAVLIGSPIVLALFNVEERTLDNFDNTL